MRTPKEIKRILAAARVPYPHILMDELEEAQAEVERLRKELEEAQRGKDVMSNYLNELMQNTSNMVVSSQIYNVLREAVGREEFDPVGQEGEGNQQTLEVTLSNEGYKEHPLKFDEE